MRALSQYIPTALAAAALLVAGGVVATVPANADATKPTIDWKPCADAKGVDCAKIEVPLDYKDPEGDTIKVGVARRQATDSKNKVGSLLIDPGGPGGSGVDAVKSGGSMSNEVGKHFDVIGFDPRGINTSTQVKCDSDLADEVGEQSVPHNEKEFKHVAELNGKLATDCKKRTGPLFDHIDDKHVVQDMDQIRKALGEKKLNYLGYSYGTLMGQQYAEMFPDKIRAMVLDGNMDHSITDASTFMSTETAAQEENFNAFADWCDGAKDCALNGDNTRKVYGQLRDDARSGDLDDPSTGEPIDFYDFTSDYGFSVNEPSQWTELAKGLKSLRDSETSDFDGAKAGKTVNLPDSAIFCHDWDLPLDNYDDFHAIEKQLAKDYPNMQWSNYAEHTLSCIGNTGKTTNPQQPLDIEGAPPIVMLGNLHDFATVYPWSQTAAKQSGSTLVTYEGYSHTVYPGRTDCIDQPVDDYLMNLKVPSQGLSCDSVDKPGKETTGNTPDQPFPYTR